MVLLCVLLLTAVIVLCVIFTQDRQQLISKNETELVVFTDEWIYYQSSFYHLSTERKNWDDSRQDCQKRGADLIIINNREENVKFWIGLTYKEVEASWKWVDSTHMTSGFWAFGEHSGLTIKNCVVTSWPFLGWHDVICDGAYQWICEKKFPRLIWP
uniref:C-type lectin domain-containing protein n=1 Tax=Cyprinus carpio TaxID=7962 RepID=A0A8C2PUF0_CYPCA